ncbi:MAG: ABC transporter permease subunit, partial [Treponema sp.]|nr:ABC transporter permease subunit [Treponema sp.]
MMSGYVFARLNFPLKNFLYMAVIALMMVPGEMFESARIDGCGEVKALLRIALPLSKPILSTIAVMNMVAFYNDFIWPLLVIENNSKQVINVVIRVFQSMTGTVALVPWWRALYLPPFPSWYCSSLRPGSISRGSLWEGKRGRCRPAAPQRVVVGGFEIARYLDQWGPGLPTWP